MEPVSEPAILLWIIFVFVTAMAIAGLLWPLMNRYARYTDQTTSDTAVYRDQLKEIEADQERGLIAADEAKAAKVEISRRLLSSADKEHPVVSEKGQKPTGEKRISTIAMMLIALFVPVLSLALYITYGTPGLISLPHAARAKAPIGDQNIEALVARVEKRLRENPNEGSGWEVIAPVYLRLGRYNESARAYQKAIRILGETPNRLMGFGEAEIRTRGGVINETARQAFAKALKLDPKRHKARFWLAMAKEQDGNLQEALKDWQEFLSQKGLNPDQKSIVDGRVKFLQAKLEGKNVTDPFERLSQITRKDNTAPTRGPTRDDITAAQGQSADQRSQMINQMVSGLQDRLNKNGGSLREWQMLIRSYVVLKKRDSALKALADARKNLSNAPQDLNALEAFAKEMGLESSAATDPRAEMINQMVSGLQDRLSKNGGTLQEWQRLIRSYTVLKKRDAALKALTDARKNLNNTPDALSALETFAKELGLVP